MQQSHTYSQQRPVRQEEHWISTGTIINPPHIPQDNHLFQEQQQQQPQDDIPPPLLIDDDQNRFGTVHCLSK